MTLYSVLMFKSLYQNKNKERTNKVNKYLFCPYEGSGKTVSPDRLVLSYICVCGPKFLPPG